MDEKENKDPSSSTSSTDEPENNIQQQGQATGELSFLSTSVLIFYITGGNSAMNFSVLSHQFTSFSVK